MESSGMKVLAIVDNPDNRTRLMTIMTGTLHGCALLTTENCSKGIELARAQDPDAILLDLETAVPDWIEVCRTLKADDTARSIPVVLLTSFSNDPEARAKAKEIGIAAFLSKPLDEQELMVQIHAMAKIKAANRLQRLDQEALRCG
jgi:CheY-like chemotaxis protein